MSDVKNNNRNAQVRGTSDDDNIFNSGKYAVVNANGGDDSIDNTASHVLIYAGSGDDNISNRGKSYVTIDGGDGSDTIVSYSAFSIIYGGNGDDYINSTAGDHVTVGGNSGNDTIISNSQRVSINGGADDDVIIVNGNSSTINGGTGNDTITGSDRYMDTFQYSSGGGNDVVTNYKSNDLVHIVSGKISGVSLNGSDFVFKVGSGSLTLKNSLNTSRIRVMNAKGTYSYYNPADYITGAVNTASVSAEVGRGGYNFADNTTIISGDGHDIITNRGKNVYISTMDGNDTVTNTGESSIIDVGAGNDYVKTKGNSVLVNSEDGNDYIYNGTSNSDSVTVNGGDGNDSITNYGAYSQINGDADNDYIFNAKAARYSTLSGGDGDDTIKNSGAYDVSISGGAGDDSLYSNGKNVTINGGIGSDTIRVTTGTSIIQYAEGDGDDVVYGYKTSDTIYLTSGSITNNAVNGSEVILYIGEGSIKLKNTKGKKVTVVDSSGNKTSQVYDGRQNYSLPEGVVYNNNKTAITVSSSSDTSVSVIDLPTDFASTVKLVAASKVTNEIMITGNDKANVLKAGSGGSTLAGGKGTDALYGGAGADTFVYSKGDGNDTIYKYESAQDSIVLSSDVTVSRVSVLGKAVTLHFEGGGSLKISDGKGKELTITDSSGSTGTYTFTKATDGLVSTSTDSTVSTASYMERPWFIKEEENFANELDSLIYNATTNTLIDNLPLNSADDSNFTANILKNSSNYLTRGGKDGK